MKDTTHIRWDFPSVAWVMPQGGTLGRWGCPDGQKIIFFKHGHVAHQIEGGDEQNIMQVKLLSYGQTGDLGVRSKVKYHYILVTMSLLKIFIPNFVYLHTNERYKAYQTNFQSVAWVLSQGWTLGRCGCPGGQQKFQTWPCGISN